MKTFAILLLISLALSGAQAYQERRTAKIPANIKGALKKVSKVIVSVMVNCIKQEFKSKAEKFIPGGAKMLDKVCAKIEGQVKSKIDSLRRRRTGIKSTMEKAAEKAKEAVKIVAEKAAEKAKEAVKIAAEKAGKVAKQVKSKIDSLKRRRTSIKKTAKKAAEKAKKAAEKAEKAAKSAAKKAGGVFKKCGKVYNKAGKVTKGIHCPKRRRTGIKKTAKKAAEKAKKAAEKAKKAAKSAAKKGAKVAKKAGKVVKKAGKVAKGAAIAVDKMTGGALGKVSASQGCPALGKLITAGLTSVGVAYVPACIIGSIVSQCKKAVLGFFKRQRILRRLASIKREFMNM